MWKISGEGALLNNEYEIEGDQTIMLKFAEMFAPPKKGKKLTKQARVDVEQYSWEERCRSILAGFMKGGS